MGKKGPCLHCGINSTPLWRNGPADKPVLCNACGSRFKLKGYLDDDYFPKNVQYLKNFKTEHGGTETETDNLDDHDDNNDDGDHDQVHNHVPPSGTGSSTNMPNPDDDHMSSRDFGKKNPSKRRSWVEYQQMTPMEEFHKQLLDLYKSEMGGIEPSPEDDLMENNMNNFIPSNEIGLGTILLKTHIDDDDDATSTDPGSLASSSIENPPLLSDQSSTTAPSDDH